MCLAVLAVDWFELEQVQALEVLAEVAAEAVELEPVAPITAHQAGRRRGPVAVIHHKRGRPPGQATTPLKAGGTQTPPALPARPSQQPAGIRRRDTPSELSAGDCRAAPETPPGCAGTR
jgi:hypothetical protein